MSTLTTENLESLLQKLSLEGPVPSFPGADITNNPIDVYRCVVADAVAKIVGCDREAAFDSVQRTSSIANGDLVIVVPRLKLKGVKPQELAQKIASEVGTPLHLNSPRGGELSSSFYGKRANFYHSSPPRH